MTKLLPALMLALVPVAALAEPVSTFSSIVQTSDLDLASQAGQRALDRRLSIAVDEVCGAASAWAPAFAGALINPSLGAERSNPAARHLDRRDLSNPGFDRLSPNGVGVVRRGMVSKLVPCRM